ncbi:hypothetical protein [Spiroplasma endosymbiont of Diplazon laetatorius]|uniref:hypothetical protein n=1 Tax=Spiroplasma endosymbiont of Diplazon laetatorius TaxID=3066322 RepID=UPI0030D36C07
MKNFLKLNLLSLFGSAFLGTTSSSINENTIQPYLVDGVWEKVFLKHNINTPPAGTHDVEDTETETWSASSLEWETILSKRNEITAIGNFDFGTYKDPLNMNRIQLQKNEDLSDSTIRVWKFHKQHDAWKGWGHQTSSITLKVTAKYDTVNAIVGITLVSYIYARTAGSTHQCRTSSEINKIDFKG